jgi:nucleotide-binding universal stress UspA family protein
MKLERILVAVDGQPAGQHALEKAVELARAHNAHLTALVVQGRLPRYGALTSEVSHAQGRNRQLFDTLTRLARDQADEHDVQIEVTQRHGSVETALFYEASKHPVDLIVLGLRSPLAQLVSTTRPARLARRTACPLLLVT